MPIDVSPSSALAICPDCGRREICRTRASAREWLASHEAHSHPGSHRARDTLLMAARRSDVRTH